MTPSDFKLIDGPMDGGVLTIPPHYALASPRVIFDCEDPQYNATYELQGHNTYHWIMTRRFDGKIVHQRPIKHL